MTNKFWRLFMNFPTFIIAFIVAVILVTIIVVQIKNKKKGKGTCNCGLSCGGCAMKDSCHKDK